MAGVTRPPNAVRVDDLEAVFFDFDGVLVDSLDIKVNAFLSLCDRETPALQQQIRDYFYRYTGRSRQEKIENIYTRILDRAIDAQTVEALSRQFSAESLQAVIECDEIPGADALLEHLPTTVKKFVVSGTPEHELITIINARNMAHHFDAIKGTPRRKEDNIADLLAQHRLNASACLMLGDGHVDLFAAEQNQLHFIGVAAPEIQTFSGKVPTGRDLAEIGRALDVL